MLAIVVLRCACAAGTFFFHLLLNIGRELAGVVAPEIPDGWCGIEKIKKIRIIAVPSLSGIKDNSLNSKFYLV